MSGSDGASASDGGRRGRVLRTLLWVTLLAHVGFCVLRIPHAAWAKRLAAVALWRERGAIGFHLARAGPGTREAVEWLARNTSADSVLLYRGPVRGDIEFVPPLLWPRLLLDEQGVPPGAASVHGRRLAEGSPDGGVPGVLVLVAGGDGLHLERR